MTRLVLCDIEGTLGSISFVKNTLFTWAADKLPGFVHENCHEPAVREQLNVVATRSQLDPGDIDALADQLLNWITQDRKETALKALQGMVWIEGYQSGQLRAHLYPDAVRQLRAWHDAGLPLGIYSSGSIQAQKLYFQYSDHGDIRDLFTGWFDTTSGPKTEAESYRVIASALGLPPTDILFLSDAKVEVDAAASAGMESTWVIRPQDSDIDPSAARSQHAVVTTLDQLKLTPG